MSSQATPDIENEPAVLETHVPLQCVFLGKTQQVMIPFFVGCWNF